MQWCIFKFPLHAFVKAVTFDKKCIFAFFSLQILQTFFYFSSTTALVQKLGKELEDANFVVKQVETIEQGNLLKRIDNKTIESRE